LYDLYEDLSSLGDFRVFEGLYKEAAETAASSYGYTYVIDEAALKKAWHKFLADFGRFKISRMKVAKAQITASSILIRAAAAFPIVRYKGRSREGNVIGYSGTMVTGHCNELVALAFCIGVFSVEWSRVYRARGFYAADYGALKRFPQSRIRQFVDTVLQDRRENFNQPRAVKFRRDFYFLLMVVKEVILIRNVPEWH
jgi:hypothetical protein